MTSKTLTMLAVGDTIVGPNTDPFFSLVTPALHAANIVIGQLEVPYTKREANAIIPCLYGSRDPDNLSSLVSAGFDVVTLAGNHIADVGVAGIEDTVAWLKNHNIASVGAGMNYREARRPVVIERDGTQFGFLSYNCVGSKATWAATDKPGCAYVEIFTHYEFREYGVGVPPLIYTWAPPYSLGDMADDIRKLRPRCDVLVVAFHKGLVHTPAKLATYEQQVSYAAIDAGADLILGHHQHVLQGIEQYKGKIIFHGLCNFVAFVLGLAAGPDDDPQFLTRRRMELFGFKPDPEYPTYPFHPEAKSTIIAKCAIDSGKISQVSYLPCLVNKQGQPEILKKDKRGQQVFDYMDKITKAVGLNTRYEWVGDEVVIYGE